MTCLGGTIRLLCDMGAFHVGCKVENHADRDQAVTVPRALVDSGSKYTWIPSKTLEKIGVSREKKDLMFTMASGKTITRSVGFAILRVDKHFTIDEVVFGEAGDMTLLGARTLEGLCLVVDARKKKLVAAGPLPAAGSQLIGIRTSTTQVIRNESSAH